MHKRYKTPGLLEIVIGDELFFSAKTCESPLSDPKAVELPRYFFFSSQREKETLEEVY